MKLTKVATSIVAVMAAVAVGGSWYTGKQVEEKYQQLIEQANSQLNVINAQYGSNIAIKEVKIDRHFFSSDATYRFDVEIGDEKLEFVGNDKIYHGPLPLNRLAKLNLSPVLMSIENNLKAPEQFKKAMSDQLGSGIVNIHYSGKTDGKFTVSPIQLNDEMVQVQSSPIKMEYSYENNAKNIAGSLDLDNFKFKGEQSEFQIQGVTYEIEAADEQAYANLGLGRGSAKVKAIEFKAKDDGLTQIKEITVKGDNILKGERGVSSAQVEAETVNVAGIDLGKFKMDTVIDFDAKLMNDMMPVFSNPETLESEQADEMLFQLLSKSLKFHINDISLENSKGKADAALLLNVSQFDTLAMGDLNAVLKALASSKFTFNVNREYLEEITRKLLITQEKLTEDEAKIKAEEEVNSIFASSMTGMSVVEGNKMKSEIFIDNGKVIFNGRELKEDELQMALFFIMMGVGSIGQ